MGFGEGGVGVRDRRIFEQFWEAGKAEGIAKAEGAEGASS